MNHIMDDYFPDSVTASGGVMVYKDGRENSDTFHATYIFPKGFLYDYSAQFGNDYPGHSRYYRRERHAGTGEQRRRRGRGLRRPGPGRRQAPAAAGRRTSRWPPIKPVHHMRNWLECMRSRQTPNADVLQRLRPLGRLDDGRARRDHRPAGVLGPRAKRLSTGHRMRDPQGVPRPPR